MRVLFLRSQLTTSSHFTSYIRFIYFNDFEKKIFNFNNNFKKKLFTP